MHLHCRFNNKLLIYPKTTNMEVGTSASTEHERNAKVHICYYVPRLLTFFIALIHMVGFFALLWLFAVWKSDWITGATSSGTIVLYIFCIVVLLVPQWINLLLWRGIFLNKANNLNWWSRGALVIAWGPIIRRLKNPSGSRKPDIVDLAFILFYLFAYWIVSSLQKQIIEEEECYLQKQDLKLDNGSSLSSTSSSSSGDGDLEILDAVEMVTDFLEVCEDEPPVLSIVTIFINEV